MLICIKQHLSNIWSWIHEKVKLHLGRVKKKKIYKKARIRLVISSLFITKVPFRFCYQLSMTLLGFTEKVD